VCGAQVARARADGRGPAHCGIAAGFAVLIDVEAPELVCTATFGWIYHITEYFVNNIPDLSRPSTGPPAPPTPPQPAAPPAQTFLRVNSVVGSFGDGVRLMTDDMPPKELVVVT
jgi:hypothetical protein